MSTLEVEARVTLTVEVEDINDADSIYNAVIDALPLNVELDDIQRTVPRSAVS